MPPVFVPDFSPLLRVLALALVALAVLGTGGGYLVRSCQGRRQQQATAAVVTHHATAARADARAQRQADSARFFLAGRRYEFHLLDSLAHVSTPAAADRLVLPAAPGRQ